MAACFGPQVDIIRHKIQNLKEGYTPFFWKHVAVYYYYYYYYYLLTIVFLQAMDLAIPQVFVRYSGFPDCFSHTLIYHIRKKNYLYRRYKKSKTIIITVNFPITGGLLKSRVQLSPTDLTGIRAQAMV
jgi:hypothetical protein